MTDKQAIKHLRKSCRGFLKEVKRLRSILNEAANCIHASSHGHTPNWKRLVDRIEKYEDAYSPLCDEL